MPIPPEKICECARCGYAWVKRVEGRPKQCPNCKEELWDVPAGKVKRGRPPKKKATKKTGK